MIAKQSVNDLGQISGRAIALGVIKKSILFDREANLFCFTGVYRFPTKSAFAKLDLSKVLIFSLFRFFCIKTKEMKGRNFELERK